MRKKDVHVLVKNVGETPLQAIERYREEHGIPTHIPMAYAGRLDPMAEGKLLVLVGEACKKIQKFWNLDKEYRVSIVIGLASDSYDVLGRLSYNSTVPTFSEEKLVKLVHAFVGPYEWPYPPLSSKPVKGKPLFQWFLEDRLDEIELPTSTGTIYNLQIDAVRTIKPDELKRRTLEKIHSLAIVTDESKRLGRDFRRHEVIDSWNTWYKTSAQSLQVIDITCTASAGTYMRTLANEIGVRLNVGALALEINRTKVGKFLPFGKSGFWLSQY